MSRNGSGVYSLPAGSTVTNGDTSDATDINTPLQDLETDANTARPIVAGGTGATSASAARTNLGVGDASDVTHASLTLDSTLPAITLDDSNTSTTHNKVAIQYNAEALRFQLRDNSDAGVDTLLDATATNSGWTDVTVNGTWAFNDSPTVSNTNPFLVLEESDGTSTYAQTRLRRDGNNVDLETRQDDGTIVSTDVRMGVTATGIDSYSFRVQGAEAFSIDADGVTIADPDFAIIDLQDTGGTDTHEIVRIQNGNGQFQFQTRDDTGSIVSSDYVATLGASGVTEHSFRVEGTETLEVTSAGVKVQGKTVGMEVIESKDASSSASLTFTGFDSSKYDAYVFKLANVVPATNNAQLLLRTSTNGGSSYDSGASDYAWSYVFFGTGTADQDDASIRVAIAVGSNDDGVSGTLNVNGPHLAKKTIVEWNVGYFNSSSTLSRTTGSGARLSSADVDAVQFLMSSGNIESGTITMYGLRNA